MEKKTIIQESLLGDSKPHQSMNQSYVSCKSQVDVSVRVGDKPVEEISKSQMLHGAFIQMASIMCLVFMQVFAKMQFNDHPSMREHHYLFFRCSIQILIQVFLLNRDFKKTVWDSLSANNAKQLLIRSVIGFFALSFQIVAIRALPLVLVSMVMNTMPLFTAVLGYIILREELRSFEKVALVLSFVGVGVMITGKESDSSDLSNSIPVFATIALMCIPVLSALVTITLRTLRGISVHTQAFYHALLIWVIMGLIILVTQSDMSFIENFHFSDYILLFGAGATALGNQTLKQKALQYDTASRVTIYNYLQSIIQFIFDIIIFDYQFQSQEIIGIFIVVVVNVILIIKIIQSKK